MSPAFEPANPDYEQRARETFARQGLMATFAAELRSIEPGAVEIEVPFSPELSQQDAFFHAGVGIAILECLRLRCVHAHGARDARVDRRAEGQLARPRGR